MERKRILILSANTGEGHNSAAKAIREALERRGCDCTILDGLIFMPAFVNRMICRGHVFFYQRLPKLYGVGYRLKELQSKHPLHKPVKAIHPKQKRKLCLENGAYDAVICAHVFAARMITQLRLSGQLDIPCYFLATDYSCSPYVNQLDMDAWLIPHRDLAQEFAAMGIPEDRLIPTGIPVRRAFLTRKDKMQQRRKLHLPTDQKIVAVSCGSMGAGAMERLVCTLGKALPEDICIAALCGSNHALRKRLGSNPRILALGYVESIADYMDASDVYVTKPGGLSTTEAMYKRVPTILFNAVPGVETRNMAFLCKIGCAATSHNAAALVNEMLNEEGFAEALTRRCEAEFAGSAADRICDVILKNVRILP